MTTVSADIYCAHCRATTPHTYIGRIRHGETRDVAVYRCACDTRRPGPWKDTP